MASTNKVKVIATDETGKDFPFATKTLTAEFKGKAGKTYKISINEPGKATVLVGQYTVAGATPPPPPPPHTCPAGQHWDEAQQKCVDDSIPPPPPPSGDLLFDLNTDIDWDSIQGEQLKVTDKYGNVSANGKGFHMNASGKPRAYLDKATKTWILEHDGKYGRGYFCVCNYACRIEGEYMLDTPGSNASFKSRNRHQFRDMVNPNAGDAQTQGGQGTSFSETKVDADCEVVHGTEISGPSASLNPKPKIGEYHSFKFSQFDKNGKIHIIDELDGKVVNEGDTSPPSQFFNKAEFETWSEFWVRLNADNGGRLYIKNLKVYKL